MGWIGQVSGVGLDGDGAVDDVAAPSEELFGDEFGDSVGFGQGVGLLVGVEGVDGVDIGEPGVGLEQTVAVLWILALGCKDDHGAGGLLITGVEGDRHGEVFHTPRVAIGRVGDGGLERDAVGRLNSEPVGQVGVIGVEPTRKVSEVFEFVEDRVEGFELLIEFINPLLQSPKRITIFGKGSG